MVADFIEECAFHVVAVGDGLGPGICQGICFFAGIDHFADLVADLGDMIGDLFQDLFLVGKGWFFQTDFLDSDDILDQGILVFDRRWQDMAGTEFTHDPGFNLYFLHIFFQLNFVTCFQFNMAQYVIGFKKVFGFFCNQGIQGKRGGFYIGQTSFFGFFLPIRRYNHLLQTVLSRCLQCTPGSRA